MAMYTYHTRKLTGKNLKLKLFCDNVFALYSAQKLKGGPQPPFPTSSLFKQHHFFN